MFKPLAYYNATELMAFDIGRPYTVVGWQTGKREGIYVKSVRYNDTSAKYKNNDQRFCLLMKLSVPFNKIANNTITE